MQFKQPKYELADIFNLYWKGYKENHNTSPWQNKAIWLIQNCRTSRLGGHIATCSNTECDYQKNAYNSCRNRNCPKCQGSKQIEWVRNRLEEILPIPYYHHIFTLPHKLNDLALCNKKVVYDLFFKSAAYTLNAFSRDPKYLNAQLGFIGILHSWGRTLSYHVHIHFIVTGGGLAKDRFKRLPYQNKFLFPSLALSRTIRGYFVKQLKKAYSNGLLQFPGNLERISNSKAFDGFCREVGKEAWYNYIEKPFSGPEQVVKYIGQYTHRIAISNHRIREIDNNHIKFRYKDFKDESKQKVMSLASDQFIQRFLWHVLPSGFKRIRHFGFLSSGNRRECFEKIKYLLDELSQSSIDSLNRIQEWILNVDAILTKRCPKCKAGTLEFSMVEIYNST